MGGGAKLIDPSRTRDLFSFEKRGRSGLHVHRILKVKKYWLEQKRLHIFERKKQRGYNLVN